MGSSSEEHVDKAEPLGHWLAGQAVHLLTGGGPGVMTAVSRAFAAKVERAGLVLAVLPAADGREDGTPRPGYPNPWVEVPIVTHLPISKRAGAGPMSRNHINVLTATVLVILPGSLGTASEAELALRYRRPAIAFLDDRADVPALPASIAATDDLEIVKAFVRRHLESARV